MGKKLKKLWVSEAFFPVTTNHGSNCDFFLADPNDPLLDRFKDNTTAKKFEPSKSLSTSSLLPTARPRISSPATSGPGHHQDIRSRVGAKVTEKTSSSMTGGLVADREPQRSVKSRLSSPKYPPMRITSTLSSRSSR